MKLKRKFILTAMVALSLGFAGTTHAQNQSKAEKAPPVVSEAPAAEQNSARHPLSDDQLIRKARIADFECLLKAQKPNTIIRATVETVSSCYAG
ncbi:MAG TPA: hypothetical protein VGO45_03245, partial [Bacteroidia bacterium]|nr:hypothetical protein [Bacteroidia bacterium]